MEFINLIKHNYKANIRGYIIIWILLLAPIAFCTTQTIQLYCENGKNKVEEAKNNSDYRDFIEYELPDGMVLEEYLPVYVGNLFIPTLLFVILFVVIMTFVFILSKRNRKDFRNTGLYVALSLLFYFALLCGIIKWFDNVTVLVHHGSAISHAHFAPLLPYWLVHVFLLGIYLGLCSLLYRIISCLRKKGILFMIIGILIILPIWILISYFYLLIILYSIL